MRPSLDHGWRRVAAVHQAAAPVIGLPSLRLPGEVASYILVFSCSLHYLHCQLLNINSLTFASGHIICTAPHCSCIPICIACPLLLRSPVKFAINVHIRHYIKRHHRQLNPPTSYTSRAGTPSLTTRPDRGRFLWGVKASMRLFSSCHNPSLCMQ